MVNYEIAVISKPLLNVDCNGERLTEGSLCCPVSDVVDCNNDTRYICRTNHGGTSMPYLRLTRGNHSMDRCRRQWFYT